MSFLVEESILNAFEKQKQLIILLKNENTNIVVLSLFTLFFIASFLTIPGLMLIVTLSTGFFFGLWEGMIIVLFATNFGAMLTFVVVKLFLKKINLNYEKFNFIKTRFDKKGLYYLFALRVVPVFPNFTINLAMPLTSIKTVDFLWVSVLGTIPGAYVVLKAGENLNLINSPTDIFQLDILVYLLIIGILPFFINFLQKSVLK